MNATKYRFSVRTVERAESNTFITFMGNTPSSAPTKGNRAGQGRLVSRSYGENMPYAQDIIAKHLIGLLIFVVMVEWMTVCSELITAVGALDDGNSY